MRDFCFFVQNNDFFKDTTFHIDRWANTFSQTEQDIKKFIKNNSIQNFKEYESKDNALTLTITDHLGKEVKIVKINNIDKYCIRSVLYYLTKKYGNIFNYDQEEKDTNNYKKIYETINDYEIENLLRLDLAQDIYINKYWKIIEDHLIKIFTSPVIKSAFKEICKKLGFSNYYDFLNEKDLKALFNRARIFQFQTDFLGLTEPAFFIDYIYYKGFIDIYGEDCSKLLNLCFYQVAEEHELLGHLNLRLQNFICSEQKSSPIIDYKDKTKGPESGDYVEMILYGQRKTELDLNEMLYLLDAENYNVTLDEFKNNFIKCKENPYKISDYLSKLLGDLNIDIKEEFKNYGEMGLNNNLIKKRKSNDKFYMFYRQQRHAEYLHPPPKISESTKKYLAKLYEEFCELYPNKSTLYLFTQ